MTKNSQYNSVLEMIRDISDDEAFNQELEGQISQRRLVKALQAVRTAKGISQAAIAEELDCSQSRVSKIENGDDAELRVGELEAYARAMDRDLHIGFSGRGLTGLDRIKQHAFAIHRELCRMAELAAADEEIAQGVVKTFNEVLFNQINLLQIASNKLPSDPESGEPYLKIDMLVDEPRDRIPQFSQSQENQDPDAEPVST